MFVGSCGLGDRQQKKPSVQEGFVTLKLNLVYAVFPNERCSMLVSRSAFVRLSDRFTDTVRVIPDAVAAVKIESFATKHTNEPSVVC
jgi:hypothetical protein